MPELPDLQALTHHLSKKLIGKTVEKIHATATRKIKTPENIFSAALKGEKIQSVYREGKEIHFAFTNGKVLGFHLMLKGQVHYLKERVMPRFTLFQIYLEDGTGVALTDYQKQAVAVLDPEPKNAPDALSRELDFQFLRSRLEASKASIKKLLVDQSVIRGIGNAYADEILWHAQISPFSICNKIPDPAIRKLAQSIKTVLRSAEKMILKKDPELVQGENRDFLAIHNPEKQESPTGAKIMVDQTGNRTTYYTREQVLYR